MSVIYCYYKCISLLLCLHLDSWEIWWLFFNFPYQVKVSHDTIYESYNQGHMVTIFWALFQILPVENRTSRASILPWSPCGMLVLQSLCIIKYRGWCKNNNKKTWVVYVLWKRSAQHCSSHQCPLEGLAVTVGVWGWRSREEMRNKKTLQSAAVLVVS